ncbi:MAG: hypothetical protein EBR82_17475 [Caulobacteraceae bacterium]|nr:hypothetical protein [Caulobacteraceae bacterium]
MKTLIIQLALVIAIVGGGIYLWYTMFTADGLASRIMHDIKAGKIYQTPGMFGTKGIVFLSSDYETSTIINDIPAESNDTSNRYIDLHRRFFQVPNDLVSYKCISSSRDDNAMYANLENISREYYDHPEQQYLHGAYKTYNDFRSRSISYHKNDPKFEIVLDSNFIKYYERIPTKTYTYQVTTMSHISRFVLVLLKGNNKWQVGAMLLNE